VCTEAELAAAYQHDWAFRLARYARRRTGSRKLKHLAASRHRGNDMHEPTERDARFERLYREHAPAVLAYALRRSSPEQAADAAAETFLVAWRRLDDVADGEALPWLYAIARRVLSTQRRAARRQLTLADRSVARLGPEALSAEEPAGRSALGALAELPERDRELLMLAAWEDLDSRAAAAVVGCSPTAFRIRLHRARKRLRLLLEQQGAASEPDRRPLTPTAKESHS
jgi:RNA polymerase sigma factor (sigma-70 family)